MGIPYFYGEVIAKSPLNKRYAIVADKIPSQCRRFFLDFNSIIHPCSALAVAKLPKETKVDEALYMTIFNTISQYTLDLVNITQPTDLLYIAVDGVAPRAKMHQQRKRRYLSAQRNRLIANFKELHGIPHTKWDSNCITPGTEFMKHLDTFLDTQFRTMIQEQFPFIKHIIISGTQEEGEGEHKMIRYIKQTGDTGINDIDIIYGLDADLIMLSMTCNNNIVLMRESQDFGSLQSSEKVPFRYLVISQMKQALIEMFCNTDADATGLIADYVFICYLLGNDFIPSLSFLKIKDGAVDFLVECYTKSCIHSQPPRSLIINQNGCYTINYEALTSFVGFLKEHENDLMIRAVEHYCHATAKPQRNFATIIVNKRKHNPNLTLQEVQDQAVREFSHDLEEYPLRKKFMFMHEINPEGDKKWRNAYYHYLFSANTPETIKEACKEYLNGLVWTVNYYFNQNACSEWCYPYHFAPCISDLYKYLHSINDEEFANITHTMQYSGNISEDTFQNKALIQLLLVLPPQSIELLPQNLQSIMKDISKGCVHYYPVEFEVQTYLKTKMWECSPLIPQIDKSKILVQISNATP